MGGGVSQRLKGSGLVKGTHKSCLLITIQYPYKKLSYRNVFAIEYILKMCEREKDRVKLYECKDS